MASNPAENRRWQDPLSSLGELATLEARCRDLPALLADLAEILRGDPLPSDAAWLHPSGARIDRHAIALLETTLDAHREALLEAPGRLFPVLYNTLYWHDAPRGQAVAAAPSGGRQLWRWMAQWRHEFEARPAARWLRSLIPPRPSCTAVAAWRAAGGAPAVSADGAFLLVAPTGETLELIDARTGRSRGTLPGCRQYLGGSRPRHGGFSPGSDRLLSFTDGTATIWSLDPLAALRVLGPCADPIGCAAFSRDGRVALTATSTEVSAWRVEEGTLVGTLGALKGITAVLPCEGSCVLVLGHDGWRLWDFAAGRLLTERESGDPIRDVALGPTGDRLVVCTNRYLEGWSLPAGIRLFRHRRSNLRASSFHPDGASFAIVVGGAVSLHDAELGEERARLPGEGVERLAFDPTGRFLALGGRRGSRLWDLAAGRDVAWPSAGLDAYSGALGWSRDGKTLAIGDQESTLVVDVTTLAEVRAEEAPALPSNGGCRVSPSGATLVVGHGDGVSFWDLATGTLLRHAASDRIPMVRDRGPLCFRAGSVVVLDPEDGRERFTLAVAGDALEYPRGEETGSTLIARTEKGLVVGFSLDDGSERYRLPGSLLEIVGPDLFVTRIEGGALGVRSAERGEALLSLPLTDGRAFRLSPDRRWLVVHAFDDGSDRVELWELAPGGRHHTMRAGSSSFDLRFGEDGTTAVLTSWGPTPQSGNSDPDEWKDEVVLEPGRLFLASQGFPPPGARRPEGRLELQGFAPDLEWDGGADSLSGAVVLQRPTGAVFVARTGRQVQIFQLEPSGRGPPTQGP